MWDKKASSFANKPKRSDYINQLIEKLNLSPKETVFDMGCGSGTLSIPLALLGHQVCAVDFSTAMLEELAIAAASQGASVREGGALSRTAFAAKRESPNVSSVNPSSCCGGVVETFERSWQQDWSYLPICDVAVSSRSFITNDIADGIAKLEAHATSRVAVTTGAGDLPYKDHRVAQAMGQSVNEFMDPQQLVCLISYLFSIGRLPRVSYIEFPGVWHRSTREELIASITRSHEPANEKERAALDAYLERHIVFNENEQRFELDYPRMDRWAYVEWPLS